MKRIIIAVTLVVGVLLPSYAEAEKIRAIEVIGNTKTSDATVILIARIEVGDNFGLNEIPRVTSDLVTSGLFKEVDVYTAPMRGGIRVVIMAKDKHSWVIAPTVYNQPTNKGVGIGFGENNLFGENKKLLMYGQIATGDSFFIGAYVDPSLKGTRFRWQWDVFLRRERVIEYKPPDSFLVDDDDMTPVRQSKINYLNTGARFGIRLFRGATADVRLRGAYVFYDDVKLLEEEGATVADVTDDPTVTPSTIPNPGAEGWDMSTEVLLQYDTRANWYGISTGNKYKFTYEKALPQIGSEFDYWYTSVRFERARKYFDRHNLVVKGFVGYGKRMPFQQEYTSGGTDLRGYEGRMLRGNFRAALTAEYSVPLFTIKGFALRGLAFGDSTYTGFVRNKAFEDNNVRNYLPGHDRLGRAPFKNSVGVGTRVFLRQIVLPLLGLDVGYGLESRGIEVYFAIGLTDL